MAAGDLENNRILISDTIPSGQALSSGITLNGYIPVGWFLPSGWTAATCSLQVSNDGVTWKDLQSSGSAIQTFFTALTLFGYITLTALVNESVINKLPNRIRIRSQTAGVDVNQLADRTFTYLLIPSVNRPWHG